MAVATSRAWRFQGVQELEGRTLCSADLVHALRPARQSDAAVVAGPARSASGVRVLSNLVYTNLGGPQHLDLFLPTTPAPAGGRPVILGLPGGGWRWVRRSDMSITLSKFAKDGYVVAVADYAFSSGSAGSRVWPTNIDDVRNAVRWLKANAARYGIDSTRVAVWGESAGGHLAALLGTDPEGSGGIPRAGRLAGISARVQAVIDFYGPTDLTTLYSASDRTRPYILTFLGGTPDDVPERYHDASPVNFASPGDPPFLIYQGETDQAVPPAQASELDQALTNAGVPHQSRFFPGTGHGFRLKPAGTDLRPEILAFLDAALNHGGAGIS